MAQYKFPETELTTIVLHVAAYGMVITSLTSADEGGAVMYTMDLDGSIPETEIPHLVDSNGLEVL